MANGHPHSLGTRRLARRLQFDQSQVGSGQVRSDKDISASKLLLGVPFSGRDRNGMPQGRLGLGHDMQAGR